MLTDILTKLSKTDFVKYPTSSTGRILFDIQMWLIAKRYAVVEVFPIDDWDHWSFRIALEDRVAPFFEPDYEKYQEFENYESALIAGIHEALKHIEL